MTSIGRRLGGGLLVTLLITVVLIGQGSVWLFDQALRRYLTTVLQSETDSLLAAITPGDQGFYLDSLRIDPDYQRPFSGRYFVIDSLDGRWRSRSLWDQRLPLESDPGLRDVLAPGPQGQELLVWSGNYQKGGQHFLISVAIDYQPLLASFDRARWLIWGLGGVVILFTLLLQQWLLRRALRPLGQARDELAEWHTGQRLVLSEAVPLEFRPLVEEINHLGRQVERIIKRSRSGLADLGHALKTPLAALDSQLQQQASQIEPDSLEAMQSQLLVMRQQLERALQKARLAPERQVGQRFDPAQDLPWLVQSLHSIHGDQLRLHLPEQYCGDWPFEREDMLELLGNLLDNACKWARTGVWLDWQQQGGELWLSVEDDGPGITADERDKVLLRGTRLDEQVSGHGLGLAIVADLVEVYGGQMDLDQSAHGGLAVHLRLPVQP